MFENQITIKTIFSLQNTIGYFVAINILNFLAFYIDKKKAKKGKWRISESTLFVFALLGGSIGGIMGMYAFRHKTKKQRFTIGFPLILILEIMVFIYYNFL